MLSAHISISTGGNLYKYVRDQVEKGEGKVQYLYGDTVGDTINFKNSSAGQILHDFNFIKNSINGIGDTNDFIMFPESTGDTTTITRNNYTQFEGIDTIIGEGKTGDSKVFPVTKISIKKSGVRAINIVEKRVTAYRRNADL